MRDTLEGKQPESPQWQITAFTAFASRHLTSRSGPRSWSTTAGSPGWWLRHWPVPSFYAGVRHMAENLSRTKPWKLEGCSRATWYRRYRKPTVTEVTTTEVTKEPHDLDAELRAIMWGER